MKHRSKCNEAGWVHINPGVVASGAGAGAKVEVSR